MSCRGAAVLGCCAAGAGGPPLCVSGIFPRDLSRESLSPRKRPKILIRSASCASASCRQGQRGPDPSGEAQDSPASGPWHDPHGDRPRCRRGPLDHHPVGPGNLHRSVEGHRRRRAVRPLSLTPSRRVTPGGRRSPANEDVDQVPGGDLGRSVVSQWQPSTNTSTSTRWMRP